MKQVWVRLLQHRRVFRSYLVTFSKCRASCEGFVRRAFFLLGLAILIRQDKDCSNICMSSGLEYGSIAESIQLRRTMRWPLKGHHLLTRGNSCSVSTIGTRNRPPKRVFAAADHAPEWVIGQKLLTNRESFSVMGGAVPVPAHFRRFCAMAQKNIIGYFRLSQVWRPRLKPIGHRLLALRCTLHTIF